MNTIVTPNIKAVAILTHAVRMVMVPYASRTLEECIARNQAADVLLNAALNIFDSAQGDESDVIGLLLRLYTARTIDSIREVKSV